MINIIPSVQEYLKAEDKVWTIKEQSISLLTKDKKLEETISHIANGRGFTISPHASSVIKLEKDDTLEKEAYRITVDEKVVLYAKEISGFIYGFQTILKYLMVQGQLPYGTINDYPYLKERSLHLDCGRKFFTKSWIMNMIEEMAWKNLNTLQLHFSDNKGFRIACETYPKVTSADHLSKKEVREIIDYAHCFGIDIIPSLDSPGHLKAALRQYPEFQLENNNGDGLDISNPKARKFMLDLYTEYAELFYDSSYFNIGGDEFIDFEKFDDYPMLETYAKEVLNLRNGEGIDTYLEFLNEMSQFLENKGFKVRVWNDGLHRLNQKETIKLNKNLQICYWTKYNKYMAPLGTFETKNYDLINYHAENFYYVLHVEAGVKRVDPKEWYATWHPSIFSGNQIIENKALLKGASYSIWCDAPEIANQDEIYEHVRLPLWAMADRVWHPHDKADYENLLDIVEKLDN